MHKIIKKLTYIILFLLIALITIKLLQKNIITLKINRHNLNNLNIKEESNILNLKELKELYSNNDIIAKIKINNILESLVVKTTDNSYYLNHDLYKKYSIYGSIFMDYRVNITDKKILIYGHNFQNKLLPFGVLENYTDYNFYKENNIIELYFEKTKNIYQIFSVYLTKDDYEYFDINIKDYQKHYNNLLNNSIYNTNISINELDNILILQTCSKEKQDYFVIVCAKKIN